MINEQLDDLWGKTTEGERPSNVTGDLMNGKPALTIRHSESREERYEKQDDGVWKRSDILPLRGNL